MTGKASEAKSGGTMPPIALTMGEPAGVGGETTLMAWLRHRQNLPCFFAIDDVDRLSNTARALGLSVPMTTIDNPEGATGVFGDALPVLHRPLAVAVTPGKPDPANAKAVCDAIELAVDMVRTGRASAIVTNPIQKGTLYAAGFSHPGHTEYLAALAESPTPPVMMLLNDELRVVPVTIHVSLATVIEALDTPSIVETSTITAEALKSDFGIARPRLAMAGLNPHAGEDGAMGNEEITIIRPAIEALRKRGIDVIGPLPPDTMFTPRARPTYDTAICMYHDQGLIPLKALDFDGGINATLGLPFVRTSPDHGTALDIAGTGVANPGSLIAALKLADQLARRRATQAETR